MERSPSIHRGLLILALSLTSIALYTGCSSSSQTSEPEPRSSEPEPSGPTFSLLYTSDEAGLVLHDANADTTDTLVPGASYDSVRARSPSGRHLAFSYESADSSHLALLDLESQSLQHVDARPAPVTYSLAWHPEEEQLAFAYYEPIQSGTRGPGAVRIATPDGSTRDVGCSAAREVLHWLPDGSLATRNDEALYVVAPSDCGTRASADAERMHEATYAPTGEHLAYIHRELTYNREAHEYTPDSSLFLGDARAAGAEEILGPDRRVRHLRWAPDGSELAFDTRADDSDHRQIAIYNAGNDQTVYLTPPEKTTGDQVHPRWSSTGNHLAFTLREGARTTAAVRVEGQTRRFGPVDGAVWGWLDDRTLAVPGPDSLRIESIDGKTRFTHPATGTLIHIWNRDPA